MVIDLGVVLGRLNKTGERFIANTSSERRVLDDLQESDSLGRPGLVTSNETRNTFVVDDQ